MEVESSAEASSLMKVELEAATRKAAFDLMTTMMMVWSDGAHIVNSRSRSRSEVPDVGS